MGCYGGGTAFHYQRIDFHSRRWPVTVRHSLRNFGTEQVECTLSNGSLFCVDVLHFLNSSNDSSYKNVAELYMESLGYAWDSTEHKWAAVDAAKTSFQAYATAKGLSPEIVKNLRYGGAITDAAATQHAVLNQVCSSSRQPQSKGMVTPMLKELRQYLSDHRDLIFTVALVAIVDAFFLDGALKSRLKSILSGFIDKAESKLNKDLNGDGQVGSSAN